MSYSATVTFKDTFINASVYDDVAGKYCKDSNGDNIANLEVKSGQIFYITVSSDQDSAGNPGSIEITGTQTIVKGKNVEIKEYNEMYEVTKSGQQLFFLKQESKTTIDVVNEVSNFEEFTQLILKTLKLA